jgi:hypothetical protein
MCIRIMPELRRRRPIAGLLLVGLAAFPGCAAFRPIRGVPASHAPAEVLGASREGRKTINLSMLVQRPPDQYRVEAGDILAVYIPGLLGVKRVIASNLGEQVVGEEPPISPPANLVDAPTMGYPITIRDDDTLVLPQLEPINVRGMTIREVERAVSNACVQQGLLSQKNQRILVSLWRPREYRVLVVRQEASETAGAGMTMLGTLNPGVSKRGSGHLVRLRAYENDVLHALSGSDTSTAAAGPNGLPGLDAENAIYIIRRNPRRGACPVGELTSDPAAPAAIPERLPTGESPVYQTTPVPLTPPVAPDIAPPPTETYQPQPQADETLEPPAEQLPPALQNTLPPVTAPPPAITPPPPVEQSVAPPRTQYGTPQNGMPIIPQSYRVIRGQSPSPSLLGGLMGRGSSASGGHSTSSYSHAQIATSSAYANSRAVQPVSNHTASGHSAYSEGSRGDYSQPVMQTSAWNQGPYGGYSGDPTSQPYAGAIAAPQTFSGYAPTEQLPPGYQPGPEYPSESLPPNYSSAFDPTSIAAGPPSFPAEFGPDDFTIDSPNVIRIPVRLDPGQSPNITDEDIKLYDGDIIFIESRSSEVFYTGGLLGGGEYMLPRDRDLRVTEAVSVAQARIQSGGIITGIGGVSALNGDVSISPSRVIIRRRLDDGRVVPLEVDLYRARLHPEEDILIQPHDLILLQYTCGEATLAFIERHILAGALFTVAASSFTTGGK